ncbi:MAG TPA: discoidin domain-containing protein [Planctomycetota bacterium]|nr:discoidin domain-containing protein [Planctomycetota bacterium]
MKKSRLRMSPVFWLCTLCVLGTVLWADGASGNGVTVMPVSPTECPEELTVCPVITLCPSMTTQCPAMETSCPAVPTICPLLETMCPGRGTICPEADTVCPALPTFCVEVATVCPLAATICPEFSTVCPESATTCPEAETTCPAVATSCPATETTCAPVETACPLADTICPPTDTQCPAEDTQCPAADTLCPHIPTICPEAVPSVTDLTAELVPFAAPIAAVTASGEYGPGFTTAEATDSEPATYWSTPARPAPQAEFLQLDLGGPVMIDGVSLLPSAQYPYLFPGQFTLAVSDDGSTWTTIADEAAYTPAAGAWYTVNFEARPLRYVRFSAATLPYRPGICYLQVAEFVASMRKVVLSWTSTGGVEYEARCTAAGPIASEADWAAASAITGLPVPAAEGTPESVSIDLIMLPAEDVVYYNVRARKFAGGALSDPSNSPSLDMPDKSPGAITDLAVGFSAIDSLVVTFTATGDDWLVGTAAEYDLRYSTAPITEATWGDATPVSGLPAPKPAGSPEGFVVSGLDEDTFYYLAIKARDDRGYESPISNVATGKTGDLTPPSAVTTLTAGAVNCGELAELEVLWLYTSGDYSEDFTAANMVDDVEMTYWSTPERLTPQPEYVVMDLGDAETVDALRLLPSWQYPDLFPAEFTVETSTDNQVWTPAGGVSDYVGRAGVWFETRFPGRNVRYIRVSIAETLYWKYGQFWIQIAEAQVIGRSCYAQPVAFDSSGEWGPDFTNDQVSDGRRDNYWSTPARIAPQPEHMTLDLGTVGPLTMVRLLPSRLFPDLFPRTFAIELSVDGSTWTQVAYEANYTARRHVWYEVSFTAQDARYVRLSIGATMLYAPANVYYIQVGEFRAYRPFRYCAELSWRAPSDTAGRGAVSSYDIRARSIAPVTDANWASATPLTGEPVPEPPGTVQWMLSEFSDLPRCREVFFGLKSLDDAGFLSALSNSPSIDTPSSLLGDINCDCRVNILDLIIIRNKLGQDPYVGSNFHCDVNMDRRINILDLIMVRNHLSEKCP